MNRVDDDTTNNPGRGCCRGIPHDRRPRDGVAAFAAPPPTTPVVTRSALAPALTAGRGADVAFLEQEAEKARDQRHRDRRHSRQHGSVGLYDPGRGIRSQAVKLQPGQYVEFTLPAAANAITVRYSIPDAATGGGLTAPLAVKAGSQKATLTMTSQYAYLYNQYPFSNDPQAGCCTPTGGSPSAPACRWPRRRPRRSRRPFRPMKFYDEQRLLLGKTLQGR